MRMKKIISAIAACVLVCGSVFSVNAADKGISLQKAAAVSYDNNELAEYAEQVAVLVNKERIANGLQPVKVSPALSKAANIRAGELQESFSHTRPNGTSCFTAMSELGITYRAAAENIAYGQKNPKSVMNSWMNSSGHRANILNKNMEYIGVGVVYRDGIYYWSQFFAASNSLYAGAYLPKENEDTSTTPPTTTTTQPITTTQVTTTSKSITTEQSTTTTKSVTTAQTSTTAKPITTTQTSTAVKPIITAQTSTTAEPITTTQAASTQPVTTEQATTTTKCAETVPCIIITQPVISLPSSGECFAIGNGAYIIIYHN